MQKNQQKTRCADPFGRRRRGFVRRFGPFPGPGSRLRCAGLFASLALSLALAMPLAATEHRGIVKFAGLPVPGVTVTASQADKKLTAVTDDQGIYTFPNLSDGLWNIQVEMQCFETIKREIAVAPDSPGPEWDLKLQSFDEIKASAPAPAPSAPKAAETSASTTTAAAATPSIVAANAANASAKSNAPAKGKGKKGATAPPTAAQTGFQKAQVNASPGAATNAPAEAAINNDEASKGASDGLLINGSVNNGAASPFAQNPAFGNARRGGRSLYNGSLGVVLDSSVLDAESYSLTGQPTPKPPYTQLTGLMNFGGPIKIPHVHFKSAPFFTVNYQYLHNHQANITPGLMPTAAEREGDLSALPSVIYDPVTGNPFPGNIIPQNRISPQASALLGYYPQPNFIGSTYNYQAPVVQVNASNSMQTRVNKTLTPRWQINGGFGFSHSDVQNPNLFDFLDHTNTLGQQSNVNLSHRIGTRMFLNLGIQYSRQSIVATPYFANRVNVSGMAGITGNDQSAINYGPPNLGFAQGLTGLSDANYSATHNQTTGASASLSWSHSPHNFQFGADVRRQQFNSDSQSNPRGGFSFTGAATGVNGVAIPGSGSDLADFLLGVPDAATLAYGNADKYFRGWFDDLHMNDDWRVSPGLTVNAGVRWEYNAPFVEKYNRLVNLDIAPGYAAVQPVVATNPVGPVSGMHYPSSLVQPDKHGISPRIGIAWRPFPASSFVVRAGYGLNFNTSNYGSVARSMSQQAPLSRTLNAVNSASNPLTLANAFYSEPNISLDNFGIDPDFRVGYAQSWNVVLQRDLPGALQMTATYMGIKGTRAQQAFYPNTFAPGSTDPCAATPKPASCPPSGFLIETSNGNSSREQGQVQLRRRLRNGITASAMYTFSKSIDDAGLGGGTGGLVAQNWLDLSAERGLSTFDQRHLLNLTAQYSSGVGVGGGTLLGGWRGVMMKDWTVTTAINIGSGLPLSPSCGQCFLKGSTNTATARPEYTGLDLYAAPPGRYLNPAAYILPIGDDFGNAGRDSITGPGQFSLIASMARTFRINDRFNTDLRFDSTNTLNHIVFGAWNVQYGSSQFGFPINPNGMRNVRVTLRLRF
jgi:trimeric autotransporter adhesin